MTWNPALAALITSSSKLSDDSIDGVPLAVGIACTLRQFHASTTDRYLECVTQAVRTQLHASRTHLSPLTSHLPPPTSHLPPLTAHLSLLTSHLSPLTSHLSPSPSPSPSPRYVTQAVRAQLHASFTSTSSSRQPTEPPAEVVTLLQFLDLFSRHAGIEVPGLDLFQTAVGAMS